jgi:hypothetical protein
MQVTVVTGSREWADRSAIEAAMHGAELLIVGDCETGADAMALETALAWDVIANVYCASKKRHAELSKSIGNRARIALASDWDVDGSNQAGPIRNSAIRDAAVVERDAEMDVKCNAFLLPMPKSRGTRNCMTKLRAAGFAVNEVWA